MKRCVDFYLTILGLPDFTYCQKYTNLATLEDLLSRPVGPDRKDLVVC